MAGIPLTTFLNRGTHANRPAAAAALAGYRYLETDTLQEFQCDGTNWNSVGGAQVLKIAKVALTGGVDTGGGLGSWVNPEAGSIIIDGLVIDVTTIATAACNLDAGMTAVSAVTASDNLIDGIDIHTATGQFDNFSNKGVNGKSSSKVAAGKWVTFSMADAGASAGFAGNAYIAYYTA